MASSQFNENYIDSALQELADTFLKNVRTAARGNSNVSGWGQYLPPPGGNQVGLYGTCSGIICVSLAHGGNQVPDAVADYINVLWANRNTPGHEGARNFALTARCAYLTLALRLADDPRLQQAQREVGSELLNRIDAQGLFKPWHVDANHTSHVGSSVASSLAILAFALAPSGTLGLPDDVINSAKILQKRLEQPRSVNDGIHTLLLSSTALALRPTGLSAAVSKVFGRFSNHSPTGGPDALDFWDYSWRDTAQVEQRRDYMHIPSAAIELLLASTLASDTAKRKTTIGLAANIVNEIHEQHAFFGGRDIATSKSQAWIALALTEAKKVIRTPEPRGLMNWLGT